MLHQTVTARIKRVAKTDNDADVISEKVWTELPPAIRERLGRTRLRQLVGLTIFDPGQLDMFTIDGVQEPMGDVLIEVLETRARKWRSAGEALIRRAETIEAEIERRLAETKKG